MTSFRCNLQVGNGPRRTQTRSPPYGNTVENRYGILGDRRAPGLWCTYWTGIYAHELDQRLQQPLGDRLHRTNLRGPRWTGYDNQITLTESVATSMRLVFLRSHSLTTVNQMGSAMVFLLNLRNGTSMALPTTGYWSYSGNNGLEGITAPMADGGLNQIRPPITGFYSTGNYRSTWIYLAWFGNPTDPHWKTGKILDWTDMKTRVHTSDKTAASQCWPIVGWETAIAGCNETIIVYTHKRPDLLKNAVAAVVCEHCGTIEWKDNFSTEAPEFKATEKLEPVWTVANSSDRSTLLRHSYIHRLKESIQIFVLLFLLLKRIMPQPDLLSVAQLIVYLFYCQLFGK
ncbi:hypothetical protein IW262DRAFT_1295343 [Armillaria fumosa]|nr:hypothetical protein IW262DRAFT_1295343 [Armillaria fumosa]